MTDYVQMERSFIERTVEVLDQYHELVMGRVSERQEYEVTLLMNCMLGLLIYPQQIAKRNKWDKWLAKDRIEDVGSSWGLRPEYVLCPGRIDHEGDRYAPLELAHLTIRRLLRQMRNTAAHASFKVHDSGEHRGKISHIVFHDEREHGLHLVLPVDALEAFVRKLASTAVQKLEQRESNA